MLENTEGVIKRDNPDFITPSELSNMYLSCVLCTLCCQFLWIVHFLSPLRYSLTCICPVSCVLYVASFSGLSFFITPSELQINVREYRRGNEKKDNPEKLATLGTQDTGEINAREYRRGNRKGQSRETGNIRYTRHITKHLFLLCLVYPMLPVSLDCLFFHYPFGIL
jgi:hypothetical protein